MASATCLVVSAPVAGCSAVLNRRVLTKCKVRRLHPCNVAHGALQKRPPVLSSISDSHLALLQSLMVQSRSLRENGPRLNKRAHPCCLGDDARTCTQPEPPRIGKTIPGRREPDTNAASLPDDVIQKAYSEGEEFVGLHRRLVSVSLAAISSFLALSFTLEAAAAVTEGDPRPSQGGATTGKGGKKANVFELNGGVKALDVRIGSGPSPKEGDKVSKGIRVGVACQSCTTPTDSTSLHLKAVSTAT